MFFFKNPENHVRDNPRPRRDSRRVGSVRPFVHGDQPGSYRERLGLSEEKEGPFLLGGGDFSSGREGNREAAVQK